MARKRTLETGVVNIKTHPHSKKKYANLFEKTHKLSQPGKIRGSDWGMFGTMHDLQTDEDEHVKIGRFYKFLNIDPRGDWLDIRHRKPLNADEDEAVPIVPEYLKPNLKECPYVFYPKEHRLFFDAKILKPNSMRTLLNTLFSAEKIFNEFGKVDIEVESTSEIINRILAIPRITRLSIDFSFPNADDLEGTAKKVVKRFKKRNIRRHKQVSTTTHPDGIEADIEMKAMMNVAKSNGRVTAVGYEKSKRIVRSTVNHPMIEPSQYDPEVESVHDVMLYSSTLMLNKIKG